MDFVMTELPRGGQDIIWEGIGFWERCLGNTAHQKTREGDGVLGVFFATHDTSIYALRWLGPL